LTVSGALPSLGHSECLWLVSYRRSGNGVIIRNNNTRNSLHVMFIGNKAPLSRRYMYRSAFQPQTLPLPFPSYRSPRTIQSPWDVRTTFPPQNAILVYSMTLTWPCIPKRPSRTIIQPHSPFGNPFTRTAQTFEREA
jgi:hypothetical protein